MRLAAGLDILRAALADTSITRVTVLSRRELPSTIPTSSKLATFVDSSFPSQSFYTPERLAQLRDHSACIWALGKTSVGMNEEEYTKLTVEYAVEAMGKFLGAGVRGEDGAFRFVYVSGMGAVTEGKGAMWARVKVRIFSSLLYDFVYRPLLTYLTSQGKAETELTSLAQSHSESHPDHKASVVNIRPGYFFPSDSQDAKSIRPLWMRVTDKVLKPVLGMSAMKAYYIDARELGAFAVGSAKGRVEPGLYSNAEMRECVDKWKVAERR